MFDTVMALDVDAVCRAVLSWLGQAVLLGSILAMLTWALLRVFHKRVPPALEMALWCVVLLRFVVPGGLGWAGSLANLCTSVMPASRGASPVVESLSEPSAPEIASIADGKWFAAAAAFPSWSWAMVGVAAYVAVLVGLAAVRAGCYRRFRAAHMALPEAGLGTRRMVRTVCDRVGIRRTPLIRISDDDRAPFVMGVLRPLIVLSRRQLVRPDELETVIVHEVTHLRRGDALVRCMQCIAGLLFFFWPVVAWVNRQIERTREYACDEWALRRGKLTPGQYARCLFEAARWRRPSRWTYAPACMAGNPSTIERRIDMVLSLANRPPRGILGRLGGAAFLIAWCSFGLAGADEPGKDAKPVYEPTEQGMRDHAQVLFNSMKELPGADLNGDGEVTKEECWAYVTAVILSRPDAILKDYPWADQNHNGQLEPEEAFLLGRGDYDFQKLREGFAPEKKKAGEAQDEAKIKVLQKKMMTSEYATWHVILDRRQELVAQATPPPSAEFVRKVFDEHVRAAITNSEFDVCVDSVKKVAHMKQEAQQLRQKAARADASGKPALEAKAAEFETMAAELANKMKTELNARIEKLDAQGPAEEAMRYRGLLKKLDSL